MIKLRHMQDANLLQDQVKAAGARMAMLLQAADIPQEEKDSWAAVIPEMTLAQAEQLVPYLISKIPEEIRAAVETVFEGIQQAEDEHQQRVGQADVNAEDGLAEIENELSEE